MPSRKPKTESSEDSEAPALKPSPKCPSCGAESVVVFPVLVAGDGTPIAEPRLVCIKCHPKGRPAK
jgi:transposase-like protein